MEVDQSKLVLAVYPNARGVAFVLFEGPMHLIDWGIREARRRQRGPCVKLVETLVGKHRPDVLVLREMPHARTAAVARQVVALADGSGVPVVVLSRTHIRQAFSALGRPTRVAILDDIVRRLPVLASFRPGRHKIWNGEDRRMGLFDAAALALTFFMSVQNF